MYNDWNGLCNLTQKDQKSDLSDRFCLQADEYDVPSIKLTIHDAEVLWNPFDDLQPRVDKEEKKAAREEAEAMAKVR